MKTFLIAVSAVFLVACQTQPPVQKPIPFYCKTICTLDNNCVMECYYNE